MYANKVAVVTGGTSGMGLSVVKYLLENNWRVFVISRRNQPAVSGSRFLQADISSQEELASAFRTAFEDTRRLDFVFANAGHAGNDNYFETSQENPVDLSSIDINLGGTIRTASLAREYFTKSPHHGKGAVLVMNASIAGLYPIDLFPVYSVSKAGIVAFTQTIAPRLFRDHGIQAHAICPGLVQTNFLPDEVFNMYGADDFVPVQRVVDTIRRLIEPDDFQDSSGRTVASDERHGLILEVRTDGTFLYEKDLISEGSRGEIERLSGHLGRALMLALPSLGYTPLGIDILPSTTTSFVGSFTDRAFVEHILSHNTGIRYIIHAGGLHKPHIVSHSREEFINTNVTGTMILVDEAGKLNGRIEAFVLVSTTSAFGSALIAAAGEPAVWIDESVVPRPKNIYGVSKIAAEDICYLAHSRTKLPVVVLRCSRFFPQPDDDEIRRNALKNDNMKVLELCYRRVDITDVVSSCTTAMRKAKDVGFGLYVISAPTPFHRDHATLAMLNTDAKAVVQRAVPQCAELFSQKGWGYLDKMDRVYDSNKAMTELGWRPEYTFEAALARLQSTNDWRSELAKEVGRRGYHAVSTGFYTAR
ncbi:unnamed protein product [Fusarium graminearum]|nr:unnamed protein product [Fusarium graminearum]